MSALKNGGITFVVNVEFKNYEEPVDYVHDDIVDDLSKLVDTINKKYGLYIEAYCDEIDIVETDKNYQDSLDRENFIEDTKF